MISKFVKENGPVGFSNWIPLLFGQSMESFLLLYHFIFFSAAFKICRSQCFQNYLGRSTIFCSSLWHQISAQRYTTARRLQGLTSQLQFLPKAWSLSSAPCWGGESSPSRLRGAVCWHRAAPGELRRDTRPSPPESTRTSAGKPPASAALQMWTSVPSACVLHQLPFWTEKSRQLPFPPHIRTLHTDCPKPHLNPLPAGTDPAAAQVTPAPSS